MPCSFKACRWARSSSRSRRKPAAPVIAHPRRLRAGMANTLQGFRDDAADRLLAGVAATTALAAMLACLAGTGASVLWLVAGIADGLAAVYLLTEVRRARDALGNANAGSANEVEIRELLARWQGQQVWLAATAAGAQVILIFLL